MATSIVLTRDLRAAKAWIREKAQGSERYGIIVSSQAERLKSHALDVKTSVKPVHWFLNGKDDVRPSYYLEDVATIDWKSTLRQCIGAVLRRSGKE